MSNNTSSTIILRPGVGAVTDAPGIAQLPPQQQQAQQAQQQQGQQQPVLQFVTQGSVTAGHAGDDELVQFQAKMANFLETTMMSPEFRQALLTNTVFAGVMSAGIGMGSYSELRAGARNFAMDSGNFGGAREGLFESASQLSQLAAELYGRQGDYTNQSGFSVIPSWNNMSHNQVAEKQQSGVAASQGTPYTQFAQHPDEHSPWEDMEVAAGTAVTLKGGYNKIQSGAQRTTDAWEKWQNKGETGEMGETDAAGEVGEVGETAMEGEEVGATIAEGAEIGEVVGEAAAVGFGGEALIGAGGALAMATGVGEIALGIAAIGFGVYEAYKYFSGSQAKADFNNAETAIGADIGGVMDTGVNFVEKTAHFFGWL